ncbi:hydroxylase [Polynucleobacter paneuropaeus]|nr:hydroxylase [Polynucleobacter paneuropaeus]
MKLIIDTDEKSLCLEDEGVSKIIPLYSKEGYELISNQWLKVGWNQKYPYTFSWFGRPIIQLPEDMIRIQEVIYRVKPDVIVETGVAHGGSLIYYASIFEAMGKGRVIGVDILIRPENRRAIESHELAGRITLIAGSSTDLRTVAAVKDILGKDEKVLVILDSNHTKEHVAEELRIYHTLVSSGSYIVATDGSMKDLHDVPRGSEDWSWNNPTAAAAEFASNHAEFTVEQPIWPFNESGLSENVTHWPGAWLLKK